MITPGGLLGLSSSFWTSSIALSSPSRCERTECRCSPGAAKSLGGPMWIAGGEPTMHKCAWSAKLPSIRCFVRLTKAIRTTARSTEHLGLLARWTAARCLATKNIQKMYRLSMSEFPPLARSARFRSRISDPATKIWSKCRKRFSDIWWSCCELNSTVPVVGSYQFCLLAPYRLWP